MTNSSPRAADFPTASMGFHTTHWTVVLAAGSGSGTVAHEALAHLCSVYWAPLYGFIRRRGSSPTEAEDLTQEFFRRFLERNRLAEVQPAGGKFRSFLLTCLKNFLANEWQRGQAQRRGGGYVIVPLDNGDAENQYRLEPVDHLTPDAIFDRRWAHVLLQQTMTELRREYTAGAKRLPFEELDGFLPGGRSTSNRAELAAKWGMSEGAVDVAIHRLRQRFGMLLRAQVALTVSTEGEVDEEIRYLISVLGA